MVQERYTIENLREKRKLNFMSQQNLADAVGVSLQTVFKWEHGHCIGSKQNYLKVKELLNIKDTEN